MVAVAAMLRGTRQDAASPEPEFVDGLARRLRLAANEASDGLAPRDRGRRRFLVVSGLAAAAIVGVATDRWWSHLPIPPSAGDLTPDGGAWQRVAALADIPVDGALGFSRAGVFGYLTRSGTTVIGVAGACTHMGCLLNLDAPARQLRCPCHGASFSLTGHPSASEYQLAALPRLAVRVRDEAVEVLLPSRSVGDQPS